MMPADPCFLKKNWACVSDVVSDIFMIVNKKHFISHRKVQPTTGGKLTVFI